MSQDGNETENRQAPREQGKSLARVPKTTKQDTRLAKVRKPSTKAIRPVRAKSDASGKQLAKTRPQTSRAIQRKAPAQSQPATNRAQASPAGQAPSDAQRKVRPATQPAKRQVSGQKPAGAATQGSAQGGARTAKTAQLGRNTQTTDARPTAASQPNQSPRPAQTQQATNAARPQGSVQADRAPQANNAARPQRAAQTNDAATAEKPIQQGSDAKADATQPAKKAQANRTAQPSKTTQPNGGAQPSAAVRPEGAAQQGVVAKPDGSARPQKAAQPANGAQPAKATQQAGAAQPNGTATTAKAAQAGGPARTATTSQQGGTAQQGNAARPQKAAQPNKTPQAAKVPQVNPTPSADQKPTSQPEPANAPETAPVEETPETPDLRERFVSEAKRFLSNPIAYFQQSKRAIVVAVLLLVYIVGSLFFSYHFLPGTEINGAPASMASVRTLAQHAEEAATDYKVNISGDEVNATINGTGIAFAFDADAYRHEATSKLPGWAWPVKLFTPRNYILESAMTYDKDLLQDLVDSAVSEVNENKTAPKDATVSYDAKSRTFSAVEEEPGTNVDLDRTTEKVKAAIQTLQREVQLDENDLEQPAVTTKDSRFDQALARANQLNNLAIPLAVEGEKVETIEPEQICKWITINKDYQPSGDLEEITYWAQSDLSDEVDTVGTQRTYLRPDGQKEQVAGGSYGWIIDGKSLAVLIQERIEQNSNEIIEIPMSATAINYNRGGQDWGNRYIDVDLTAQYVRFYDNNANLIWESECVSGDISQSQATITGVYTIQDKESPATLVGLDYDFDGEPDYENEVEYWMPFYGGYGLHDALWRSYFGEDIYQYDGSHGCVNLPYYKAQSLYEMVRVGDVVVVHY